jgi:hypothetical protein
MEGWTVTVSGHILTWTVWTLGRTTRHMVDRWGGRTLITQVKGWTYLHLMKSGLERLEGWAEGRGLDTP